MSRPDAVIVPKSAEAGPSPDARRESIVGYAEPLLQCSGNELAWCHDQVTYFFCTRKAEDTELYPYGHTKELKPRYRWEAGPNGTKLGYLLDDQA